MNVFLIGGPARFVDETYSHNLKELGLSIIGHQPYHRRWGGIIPEKAEAVIILTDMISHNHSTKAVENAKKLGIPYVLAQRKWASAEESIKKTLNISTAQKEVKNEETRLLPPPPNFPRSISLPPSIVIPAPAPSNSRYFRKEKEEMVLEALIENSKISYSEIQEKLVQKFGKGIDGNAISRIKRELGLDQKAQQPPPSPTNFKEISRVYSVETLQGKGVLTISADKVDFSLENGFIFSIPKEYTEMVVSVLSSLPK